MKRNHSPREEQGYTKEEAASLGFLLLLDFLEGGGGHLCW